MTRQQVKQSIQCTHGFSKSILIRKPELSALLVLGLGCLVAAWRGSSFAVGSSNAGAAVAATSPLAESLSSERSVCRRMSRGQLTGCVC